MSTRNKRRLAITVAALLLGSALGVYFLAQPTPSVTYANFSRLDKGMSRDEVEGYLGKSNSVRGRQVGSGSMEVLDVFAIDLLNEPGWSNWQNDAGDFVSIQFNKNDRVSQMTWNGWSDDRTSWEKLRDRIPWIGKKPPAVLILVD